MKQRWLYLIEVEKPEYELRTFDTFTHFEDARAAFHAIEQLIPFTVVAQLTLYRIDLVGGEPTIMIEQRYMHP